MRKLSLIAVALTSCIGSVANAQLVFETRALTGDFVDIGDGMEQLASFWMPLINDAGEVVFNATYGAADTAGTIPSGIFTATTQRTRTVAYSGQEAFGISGGVLFSRFETQATINQAGQVEYRAYLSGQGVDTHNDEAIYSEVPGSSTLVFRNNSPIAVPGLGSGVELQFARDTSFDHADTGPTAFIGQVTGVGVDEYNSFGVFYFDGSQVQLAAREGDPALQSNPNLTFDRFDGRPAYNLMGETAFTAVHAGDQFVYSTRGGVLHLIAQPDMVLPSFDQGEVIDEPSINVIINENGFVAFGAGLDTTPGGPTIADAYIILAESSTGLREVARSGDSPPNLPDGMSIRSIGEPSFNDQNRVAFVSELTGGGASLGELGIFAELDTGLELVAKTGDQIEGANATLSIVSNGDPVAFSDTNQIATLAQLKDDITNEYTWALLASDKDGNLILVAREGDLFDVNDDPSITDLRTISRVSLAQGFAGQGQQSESFNNKGQLAFSLSFSDGSQGIFVANVPEPSSVAIFTLAPLFFVRRMARAGGFRMLGTSHAG